MSNVATVRLASKLAPLVTRLGSGFDGEIIAAVKAIERALKSHKYDWHDFAAWISIPASVTHDSIARGGAPTWDDLDDVLRREWLRAALDCGCLNGWSRNFASDISRNSSFGWLSWKQVASLDRILRTRPSAWGPSRSEGRLMEFSREHPPMSRRVGFDLINRAALAALPAVLTRLIPGGKILGHEYVALNPTRADRRPGSFAPSPAEPKSKTAPLKKRTSAETIDDDFPLFPQNCLTGVQAPARIIFHMYGV